MKSAQSTQKDQVSSAINEDINKTVVNNVKNICSVIAHTIDMFAEEGMLPLLQKSKLELNITFNLNSPIKNEASRYPCYTQLSIY